MSALPAVNVRVFRIVAAAWLVGWFWKIWFFAAYYFDEIWAYRIHYAGLPRVLVSGARALAIGALVAIVVLPPFWLGYVYWYRPRGAFTPAPWPSLQSDVLGQLLGVAFPEEAFFRGYLQSALDAAWPPTRRVLGVRIGPSILVTSAIFAVGHLLTEPYAGRLAVFFPSLLFGFLRAREGGIGAAIVFHALCNLFASYLGQSYGLSR